MSMVYNSENINILELQTIINKHYSDRLGRNVLGKIVRAESGVYHDNYIYKFDEEKLVVRINKISQWGFSKDKQINYEYDTLKDLETSNVTPVPKEILRFKIGNCTSTALVEKFIEGHSFNYKKDLSKAAVSLSKIHKCKPFYNSYSKCLNPGEMLYKDAQWRLAKLEESGFCNSKLKYLRNYEKYMSYDNLPICDIVAINHTDLNAGNLIVSEGTCYVIDWEGARLSSFIWDIAHFIAATTTLWDKNSRYILSNDEKSDFINMYIEASCITHSKTVYESVFYLLRFIYFRCFAWALEYYSLSSGNADYNTIADTYMDKGFIEACFADCIKK